MRNRAGECPTCGKIVVVPDSAVHVEPAAPGSTVVPHPSHFAMKAVKAPKITEEPFEIEEIPAELLNEDEPFPAMEAPVAPAAPGPPAPPPEPAKPPQAQLEFVEFEDQKPEPEEPPAPPPPPKRDVKRRRSGKVAPREGLPANMPTPKPGATPARKRTTPVPGARRATGAHVAPAEGLPPGMPTPKPGTAGAVGRSSPVPGAKRGSVASPGGLSGGVPTPKPGPGGVPAQSAPSPRRRSSVDIGAGLPPPPPEGAARRSPLPKGQRAQKVHRTGSLPKAAKGKTAKGKTGTMARPRRTPPKKSKAAYVLVPVLLLLAAAAATFFVPAVRERVEGIIGVELPDLAGGEAGGDAAKDDATSEAPDEASPDAGGAEAATDTEDTEGTQPDTTAATDTKEEAATDDDEPPTEATPEYDTVDAAVAGVKSLMAQGKYALAAAAADAASAKFENNPEWTKLAELATDARKTIKERKLAKRFDVDLAKIESLASKGELDAALAVADESLERFRLDDARKTRLEAEVAKLNEAKRQAEEKQKAAERKAAMERHVADGRSALEAGRYDEALKSFAAAREMGAAVDDAIVETRFRKGVAAAEAAIVDDDRDEAIRLFKLALRIRDDADVANALAGLEKQKSVEFKLTRFESSMAAGRLGTAKAALEGFAAEATGEMAKKVPELRTRLKALEESSQLLAKAHAAGHKNRWPAALKIARRALEVSGENAKAKEFVEQAEKTINRPPTSATNSLDMELVFVRAGRTKMGHEKGARDERRVHTVLLDDFYIGRHEVTNAQYERFKPEHKKERPGDNAADNQPVVNVSWEDAAAFCAWLSKKEGIRYRLPTEAEWERAALGDGGMLFPWGNAPPLEGETARANFCAGARGAWKRDGHRFAAPIGSYPDYTSPYGAYDMAGNVAEWCADWYDAGYYKKSPEMAPAGPEKGKQRVVRGGSFETLADDLRSTRRDKLPPRKRQPDLGFRVVREVFPG